MTIIPKNIKDCDCKEAYKYFFPVRSKPAGTPAFFDPLTPFHLGLTVTSLFSSFIGYTSNIFVWNITADGLNAGCLLNCYNASTITEQLRNGYAVSNNNQTVTLAGLKSTGTCNYLTTSSDFTWFFVYNNLNVQAFDSYIYRGSNASITGGKTIVQVYQPAGLNHLRFIFTDQSTVNNITIDTAENTLNWNIVCVKVDSTNNTLTVIQNGTTYTTTNALVTQMFFAVAGNQSTPNIFYSTGSTSTIFTGSIADNYIYNTILNNTQINQVAKFLQTKFNTQNWSNI